MQCGQNGVGRGVSDPSRGFCRKLVDRRLSQHGVGVPDPARRSGGAADLAARGAPDPAHHGTTGLLVFGNGIFVTAA